jgi:elongator complex protein 3
VADVKEMIPPYCRVNRVIRDIPSNNVVEGNKRTSLRQDALIELERRGKRCQCIRCREIRGTHVDDDSLNLTDIVYEPAKLPGEASSTEHFLSFVNETNKIAGYLRLSLPHFFPDGIAEHLPDLSGSAIIREVHVFGQSLGVGVDKKGAAQHIGLGSRLIQHAVSLAQNTGFRKLAVISAIGTRQYYHKRGFVNGAQYQVMDL